MKRRAAQPDIAVLPPRCILSFELSLLSKVEISLIREMYWDLIIIPKRCLQVFQDWSQQMANILPIPKVSSKFTGRRTALYRGVLGKERREIDRFAEPVEVEGGMDGTP